MTRSRDQLVRTLAACLLASAVFAGEEAPARRVPEWGDVVDPSRDCKVTLDPARDRLTIEVPGTPHVLSAEITGLSLAAPRVVQDVYGNFKATVRVAGKLEPKASKTTDYDPYHGAGLIVWKDERTYLRLERAVAIIHGRTTPYLNYELRKDGRLAYSQGIPIKDHPLHLKVERAGAEFRAWQSPDGSRWSELPSLDAPMSGRVLVGVVAINSSRHPLRAELEQFKIDTSNGNEAPSRPPIPTTTKPADPAGDRAEAK